MVFKKIELIGFKSFADKTAIQFEPGVTAIVGPNGCGKSNISDAIRWVLGEQSARSLRGLSMEDVIFNGSNLKEPLSLAEVSLTLSNEAKTLPIDYEEVTITRRLYRSGDSEYLLNKNTVRLRDIHELLMGTGIGTESYSIIEQGKMDLILNSKPEERREIFEEAAGITKFRSKKKEALRKLEQTQNNLTRIEDIIQEVRRQIGSIERQAKKAENYRAEFEKLKNLELAVASREFLIFEDRRKTKEETLTGLKQKESEFLSAAKVIEQTYEEKRSCLNQIDEELKDSQSRQMFLSSQARSHQDRILLNRERVGELSARNEQILKQIETSKARLGEFGSEIEKLRLDYESSLEEETKGKTFLDSVQSEFNSFDRLIQDALSQQSKAQGELSQLSSRKINQQTALARTQAQKEACQSRLEQLEAQRGALHQEISKIHEQFGGPMEDWKAKEAALLFRIENKINDFKNWVWGIFRVLLEKQQAPTPENQAELDLKIKDFAREVQNVQSEITKNKDPLKEVEEVKIKYENQEKSLGSEINHLQEQLAALTQKQAELEAGDATLIEIEKDAENRVLEARQIIEGKAAEKEALLVRLAETRSKQEGCVARREKSQRDLRWISDSKTSEEASLERFEREIREISLKKESLAAENLKLEEEAAAFSAQRDQILEQTQGVRHRRQEVVGELERLGIEREQKQQFLNGARQKVHAFELESAELRFEIDRLKERIFNAYQVDLLSVERQGEELDLEQAKLDIQAQKEKLQKMGPVNLAATEEYDEMKQRFDFLTRQQQDLITAKNDLHKAILQINRTTKELFVETFQNIQKHFTEYYRLLFGGGNAELLLLDEEDVLESGIEIVARPPGKKLQNISLLSGGEKALTATALLFALFKVKPSPFCVLDEIDAPLDESNVDRFCGVLKDFVASSQFILITHNKRTMSLADAMYGITMAQTGISKVVSVKFSDRTRQNQQPQELATASAV
jgi:chromosome segregation protein